MNTYESRLDDWDIIERVLPAGWQAQAKALGALRRARVVRDGPTLLRLLLVHLADGCSLAETALRAAQAGWCRLSVVALIKRLRGSEAWLNWMCRGLWVARGRRLAALGRRVRAVDSTMVTEGGRKGSQWRIHYALNLGDLRCDFFELTEQRIGESLQRFPVRPGDLLLPDRGLCRAPGVDSVLQRQGHVLGRVSLHHVPLFDQDGRPFQALPQLRRLRVSAPGEWPAWLRGADGKLWRGRLIAIRRSARAQRAAQQRVTRKAQRNGQRPGKRTLQLSAYVLVWTDLPPDELSGAAALELYRARWQVELAFKRDKSLLGLGQLPKRNAQSSRAWLNGKLLVALLIERLIAEAEAFSPWGYPLERSPAAQPLARDTLDGA